MNDLTGELLAAVMAAPAERKEAALRMLRGEDLSPAPRRIEGPLLMGIGAAAKLLGISRQTLWRACIAGRLEKVELFPGSYRVRKEDVVAMAETRGKGAVNSGR